MNENDTFSMPVTLPVDDQYGVAWYDGGPHTGASSQKSKRKDTQMFSTPDADIFLTEDGDVTE